MSLSLHFNELMLIGLIMLPGAFVVGVVLMVIFSRWELGALAIGEVGGLIVFVAGIAIFLVGFGQELR